MYCNFHFSTSLNLKEDLLKALHKELLLQKGYLDNQPVETIYLGGGTPSLLTADEINQLFDTIHLHYNIGALRECTLETNPDDLSKEYLKSLKHTPIDRLSIGVQSFFDRDLHYMKRAHNAQEADYAIKAAQDVGFPNLTIDLIYGTPGLTNNDWQRNIAQVSTLQIPHFSAYALTVEEGTALYHNINKKNAQPIDSEQAAEQLNILMNEAEQLGYDHYEISNLALPQHYAVHNTNYWKGKHYLGIGPSAHSFNGYSRQWNIANNAVYIKSISKQQLNFEKETLTAPQQVNEYIMTSLRTQWGLDIKKVTAQWGNDTTKELLRSAQPFLTNGQMSNTNEHLILTKKGKAIADYIASELFVI